MDSPWLWLFQIFLVFDDFDSFEYCQAFCSSTGECLMFLSRLDWGYGFGGGRYQR